MSTVFRALEDSDNPSYLLSESLHIIHVNAAWTRFANDNGGRHILDRWGPGAMVLDAISGDLHEFFRVLLSKPLVTGERVEHDYECSSASVARLFRMAVYPAPNRELVVTHSLRVGRPHDRKVMPPDDAAYVHNGFIRMCANCRRVRHASPVERWDWVPAYITPMPPNVTHGICDACCQFYYYG